MRIVFVIVAVAGCATAEAPAPRPTSVVAVASVAPVAPPPVMPVLDGTISTTDGAPVAGAFVALHGEDNLDVNTAVTTVDGRYRIAQPVGRWRLSVTHPDLVGVHSPFELGAAGGTLDVTLEPGGHLYTGRVVGDADARREPVVFSTREFGRARFAVPVGADGELRVRLPDDSYYAIAASSRRESPNLYAYPGKPIELHVESLVHMAEPLGDDVIAELRAAARPVSDVATMLGADGGRPLVVGVGESTHGSRESIELRLPLTRALAERGPVVVALEANWSHALAVETYVQGGAGDPEALARGLAFFMWRNRELADALMALREHNRTRRHRIHVVGVDMQRGPDNLAALDDCPAGRAARAAMTWLGDGKDEPALTAAQRGETARALTALLPPRSPIRWPVKRCSRPYVRAAVLALLQLTERVGEGYFVGGQIRDRAMATNIAELALATRSTVVAWAHNGHVSRAGNDGQLPFGRALADDPRLRYVAIGMIANGGTFNARDPRSGALGVVELPPGEPLHLAHHLARLRPDPFALHLRALPPASRARLARMFHRDESGGPFFGVLESRRAFVPTASYDLVVYVPRLSPATLIADSP
jgi:erythromycin esterase-like protein